MKKIITKNILITGMPGAGKTFLTAKWKKLGLNVFDADDIKGLGDWYSNQTKRKVKFNPQANAQWLGQHQYLWHFDILKKFIHKNSPLIILGHSPNITDVKNLFDIIYYLKVPAIIIKKRLRSTNRRNLFTKGKEQQKAIIKEIKNYNKLMRKLGIETIDGKLAPNQILNII